MNDPRHNILRTLAFFDGFGMPLNAGELKRFFYASDEAALWQDIENALQELIAEGRVLFTHEHYHLADQSESFVVDRLERKMRAERLLVDSKNWLSIIASFPGVLSVAICNNLGFMNATEDSDVDLFIITKPGQIWQTRFFLASLLHVFKKRPDEKSHYGKFCLSFLITSDQLSISHVLLEEDPYFEYWFTSLMPVYDPNGYLPKFMEANRAHWSHIGVNAPLATRPLQQESRFKRFSFPFASFLEARTKHWQFNRFPETILDGLALDTTDVIATDSMLKFHTTDRRRHYRDKWKARCEKLAL